MKDPFTISHLSVNEGLDVEQIQTDLGDGVVAIMQNLSIQRLLSVEPLQILKDDQPSFTEVLRCLL